MPENRERALKRMWTPTGPTVDGPLVAFWRVRLVTSTIGMSTLVLAPAALMGAHFLHIPALAPAAIFLLAVSMVGRAVLEAVRIWWVFQLGRWTGWKREPIWRHEEPVRYWTRTALHSALLAVLAAAALSLIWLSLDMARGLDSNPH